MKQKRTLLLTLLALCTIGAWADVAPSSVMSSNKSYYIRANSKSTDNRGALSTYTVSGTTYLASTVNTSLGISEKKFAIITYESNDYLYCVDDGKFVTYSSSTEAPLKDVFTSTDDAIRFNNTTGSLYQIMFDTNRYFNSTTWQTVYGIKYTNYGTADPGNQYNIAEAETFDPSPVITALNDHFHGKPAFDEAIEKLESCSSNLGSAYGQYSFASPYESYTATDIENLKSAGYSAENLTTAQALVAALTLNTPPAGYYRLKNVATNQYLTAKEVVYYRLTEPNGVFADGDDGSVATVIRLYDTDNNGTLYMYNQGYAFGWIVSDDNTLCGGNAWITSTPDKYVHWLPGTSPGQLAFDICYGNGEGAYASYLGKGIYTVNNTTDKAVVGGTDYTADAAQWVVEEATTATVSLNNGGDGSYYATLCAPFAYSVSSGAAAYTLTLKEDETGLTLSEELTTVPAGTPVLLKGTTATATLNIASDAAYQTVTPLTTTALTGTYLAKTVSGSTDYFLGKSGSNVGFYHWDGTTLNANRAYFEASKLTGSSVKGLVLDFEDDATGIAPALKETEERAAIYNLSGQRIYKMQKGINIINGKKIIK